MALRLKMKLGNVTSYEPAEPGGRMEAYSLHAVFGEANKPWSKFTPSGRLDFTVTNPDAERLEVGREYFVTLEPAD